MRRITDKELKRYFSETDRKVLCDKKQRAAFIRELEVSVEDYLSVNPEADMEEIYHCFGSPDKIAQSFMENCDFVNIRKKTDIRKILFVAIVIALIIYIAFVIISLIDVHQEAHGYFEEGLLIIRALKGGVLI